MSRPAGANQPSADAPNAYVDQSSAYADAAAATESATATTAAPGGDAASSTAQSGIEKDVGTILAGLNQEQLASIVAAARASDSGEQHPYEGADQYSSSNALAHLPPGLGQAASTLTSFASSFKRSNQPVIGPDEDITGAELPEPDHLGDAPPPPGMEHDLSHASHHSRHVHSAPHHDDASVQHKAAHASSAHDSAATAAALAAMGTLAGRQLQQHGQGGLGDAGRDGGLGDGVGLDAKFVNDHSLGGARYKRKGPELDRQRKDNHKEVERRRRSAINDGIVQLSQIVPGCDVKNTNKGSIIIAAVRYIQDLKNNEASNIEKWTLEKLLMDQAMNDLSLSLDESRREVERLRAQLGHAEAGNKAVAAEKQPADDAHTYSDQRFQAPSYSDAQHNAAQGLAVAHGDAALDAFAQHKDHAASSFEHAGVLAAGTHDMDSDANKRARLV
ncbi:basic helix-loop-helix protein [Malassezia sp. CBS 17886]|nr:basic helix-loop-helix protein [Malassezia sp. CBS 17886]